MAHETPFDPVVLQATLMLIKRKESKVKEHKLANHSCSFQSGSTTIALATVVAQKVDKYFCSRNM